MWSIVTMFRKHRMFKPGSFSLWLLQIVALSLLLVFFLWLILRPSSPSYSIVDFSIPVTDLSNSSVSVLLEFSNNNKGGKVYYDNINVTVYSGKDIVGSVNLTSFSQGHEKTTQVPGMLARGNGRVMEDVVAGVVNKTADVKVGLATAVRYKIWWWRSKRHWMNMEAGVGVGVDGKITDEGKNKKIRMRKALSKKWKKWRF